MAAHSSPTRARSRSARPRARCSSRARLGPRAGRRRAVGTARRRRRRRRRGGDASTGRFRQRTPAEPTRRTSGPRSLSTADPRVTLLTAAVELRHDRGRDRGTGTPTGSRSTRGSRTAPRSCSGLDMVSDAAHRSASLRLPVHAPELFLAGNAVVDNGTNGTSGNGNTGSTWARASISASSSQHARAGSRKACGRRSRRRAPASRSRNPTAALGDIAARDQSRTTTPFRVVSTTGADPRFVLTMRDATPCASSASGGPRATGCRDGLVGTGAASSITLVWAKATDADSWDTTFTARPLRLGPSAKVNAVAGGSHRLLRGRGPAGADAFRLRRSRPSTRRATSRRCPPSPRFDEPAAPRRLAAADRAQHALGAPLIGNIDRSPDSSYEIFGGSGRALLLARRRHAAARRGRLGAHGGRLHDRGLVLRCRRDARGPEQRRDVGDHRPDLGLRSSSSCSSRTAAITRDFPKQLYDNIWSSAAVGNIDDEPAARDRVRLERLELLRLPR